MIPFFVDYASPSAFESDRERAKLGLSANRRRPVRFVASRFLKKRMLRNGMPAGFRLKGRGAEILVPKDTSVEAGLEHLRRSVARMKSESQRSPHPAFGPLTLEESNLLQIRHAELHMSFVALEG